jgi:hypothetical protein
MDPLSLISVIMVLLVVFVDMIYKKIDKLCEEDNPNIVQTEIYNKRKIALFRTTYFYAIPLFLVILIFTYMLLPNTVNIILNSELDLWNFDLSNTLFILFEVLNITLLYISFIQMKKIYSENKDFIKENKE